jgi:hypothetical protein
MLAMELTEKTERTEMASTGSTESPAATGKDHGSVAAEDNTVMRKPFKVLRRKEPVEPKACPSCGELLDLHEQVEFATAWIGIADDDDLLELLAKGAWSEARTYQAPPGSDELRSWRRIRCADGGVGVVARVRPHKLLMANDFYEEPRWLTGGQAEALEAAIRLPAVPKEPKFFHDPPPDMKPCSPELKERVLASYDALHRRSHRWRKRL